MKMTRVASPESISVLLTHCILMDAPTVICWISPSVILGVSVV